MKKKLVVTVHNSMIAEFYKKSDSINKFFLKLVAKNKNVEWIAVSEQTKNEMLKLPLIFSNTINVIPAYIPITKPDTSFLSDNLQLYIKRNKKIITFYGHSFMTHENHDIYGFAEGIKLYSKIIKLKPNAIGYVLCLAETNDKKKIDYLHSLAKSLGVDDKIYWQIGAISNMQSLWNYTDVYIRPTYTDGDSVAVREVLDLGSQVVASDVCKRPKGTIYYSYGNMDDFVNKVTYALNKTRSEFAPDFSNYQKIKDIYLRLLNNR